MAEILTYLSSASILLPAAVSFYYFPKLNSELKLLSVFFGIGVVTEAIVLSTSYFQVNNLWLINIFVLLEGFVLMYLIGKWFDSKRLFLVSMFLFVIYGIFWFITSLVSGNIFEFNRHEKTAKAIVLVLLSGTLLIRLSMNEQIDLLKDYRFWMTSAVLIYFAVTLIVYSTASLMLNVSHYLMHYTWSIHSGINIIANLLFTHGFVCYSRRMNSYSWSP